MYTPNAGTYLTNVGPLTTFDNTGFMQYRQYIRRPDQGVYSIAAGGTHDLNATVINYQFAVSRGHNYGGQDFATTNFSGPQNVQFGLNESNPYRPNLQPVDNTNIYDPAAYSISKTVLPNYRSVELDYQGSASLTRRYNVVGHFSAFRDGLEWTPRLRQPVNPQHAVR